MDVESKTENNLENVLSIWELHDIIEFHFWDLVLELHCYFGDKKKYGLLSYHFFQRKQEHGGWK